MVDVFEEVEGEIRSDRWRQLARRWGPLVAAILLAALVAALGYWAFDAWRTHAAGKASEAYDRGVQAMGAGNLAAADAAFVTATKSGSGPYKAMALMQRSGVALLQHRDAAAVGFLDDAAKASRAPLLHDAAALKAALLLRNTAPLADIQKRLEPLTKDDRPYHANAREALALAKLQAGQLREARSDFQILQFSQNIPDSLRNRAEVAIRLIDSGAAPSLGAIVRAANALPPAERAPPPNPLLRQPETAPGAGPGDVAQPGAAQ